MRYFKTTLPLADYLLLAGAPAARADPITTELLGTMQTFSLTTTGFRDGSNFVAITFPDNEFVNSQNGKPVLDIPAAFGTLSLVLSNPTTVSGVNTFSVSWLSTTDQLTPAAAQGGGTIPFSYFFKGNSGFGSVQGDSFNLYTPFQFGGWLRESFTSSVNTGAPSLSGVLLSSAPASADGLVGFSQVSHFDNLGDEVLAGDLTANPEPASAVLLGTGALLCGCCAWWRRAARGSATG
jgi:hypothetical protein